MRKSNELFIKFKEVIKSLYWVQAVLDWGSTIYSGILFYLLSGDGAKNLIHIKYPSLKEEELIAKANSFQENWWWRLIVIWIIIALISLALNMISKKVMSELENEIKNNNSVIQRQKRIIERYKLLKQNVDLIFKNHLISIGKTLNISSEERISLYIVHNNGFVCCARYSQNPTLCKPGRASYPLNEGIIGNAWASGVAFVSNLPNAKKNKDNYIRVTKEKFNIPEQTIMNFSMYPRLIFGYRISNYESSDHNAVIIIESNRKDFSTQDTLLVVLKRNKDFLYNLIKDFRDYIPALARAEEEDM